MDPGADTSSSTVRSALSVALLVLLLTITSCSGSEADGQVETPTPRESVALIEAGTHLIVDVRTPREFRAGHIVGAENIDVEADDFEERIDALDADGAYLLYSQTGRRSARAAEIMVEAGFEHVVDGGRFTTLAFSGAPVE